MFVLVARERLYQVKANLKFLRTLSFIRLLKG